MNNCLVCNYVLDSTGNCIGCQIINSIKTEGKINEKFYKYLEIIVEPVKHE